ncbi:ATP-dependent DNA helicase II subunit 2, partial [Fusarium oxysporum f. sp. albedinis]
FSLTGMTWYTGNTMVLRFLQTIPSLGGIYHTNTNSYQTIPITDYQLH